MFWGVSCQEGVSQNWLWPARVLIKVKNYVCPACLNTIPTGEILWRRGPNASLIFLLCGAGMETSIMLPGNVRWRSSVQLYGKFLCDFWGWGADFFWWSHKVVNSLEIELLDFVLLFGWILWGNRYQVLHENEAAASVDIVQFDRVSRGIYRAKLLKCSRISPSPAPSRCL
ncbi:hypothetical protein LguiA_033746 [Lonicera macranthoides]